jgi:hypothetical protein
LQGEPIAATTPSDGDVLTYSAGEWTPAPPTGGGVYGTEVFYERTLAEVSSTGPGLITYVTLTETFVGGVYFLSVSQALTTTSSSSAIRSVLYIDGIPIGGPLIETSVAGGVYIFTGNFPYDVSPGEHTFEIRFEKFSGPGVVITQFGALTIWRML